MIDDRDLDGIEDKFDSTFNTPEEVLEKKSLLKLMRICSKGLPILIYLSSYKKMLIAAKSSAMKEMKKKSETL